MRAFKGQTIVEMLVVLGVFALLSAMLVTFSRSGDLQGRLSRSVDVLVYDIRRVQETSYFSREYQGTIPCGYALSFATSSYMIQTATSADCSNPSSYVFADANALSEYKRNLTSSIQIQSVTSNPIVFVRPAPRVYFFPDAEQAQITMSVGGLSETVTINKYGGINVQ